MTKTTSAAKTGAKAAKTKAAPVSKIPGAPSPLMAAAIESATAAAPKPVVVEAAGASGADNEMKIREFVDLVVGRSGLKKKDVKPAVESALAVLGEALAEGRELNLPPLGKMKINRVKQVANGRVIVCKLRQKSAEALAKQAAKQAAKDDDGGVEAAE